MLIGTFGVGIASLASFIKASKAIPGCESHSEPRRLPAITMESCPPSPGTLPAIGWTAARDRLERRPPSAWNRARHRLEYAADQLIQEWITAFQARGGPAPDDDNPFGNPLHPDIKAAFDATVAQEQAQATVVDACNHIIEHSGWGTLQEIAMKRATASDFEAAIRNMDVENLPKFMRRMIQMRLQRGTYDPHFGAATERFVEACRAIANDQNPATERLSKLVKRLFQGKAIEAELNKQAPAAGEQPEPVDG